MIIVSGVFSFTFAAVADVPDWDQDVGKRAGLIAIIAGAVLGLGALIVMRRAWLAREE